jgi:cell volume regulation protein A
LGGNGYLSAYIVGIILGNRPIKNKKALVHFFDGVTGLMQMLIFFLLGLLSFPSQLPKVALPALWIALFLTFIARPIAVFLLMKPFRCKWNQQLFISWGGLRGAASIVFAAMANISPVSTSYDVFHITFFIVLFSILIQGSLIPYMAKKLDMIDADEDVLKTFTDYTEDMPVQYIQFTIKKGHPWLGNKIEDILLPPETLLILLIRGTQNIVPKGGTVVEEGDTLILSAKEWVNTEDVKLSEILLRKGHEWVGKAISEISLEQDKLIIMILRSDEIIIPRGQDILQENDILVMNEMQ